MIKKKLYISNILLYKLKYTNSIFVNGNLEFVNLLLKDERVDPSADNNYAIKEASYWGYVEIVKLLLKDKRVDPSAEDNYAIRVASKEGHAEVVKLLLQDKRVNPSADYNDAIREAAIYGLAEVVILLLSDERVDVDKAIELILYCPHREVKKIISKYRKSESN